MPTFQTKRYEQILAQMLASVVSRTGLSDISDTSVMKHLLAAAARQDDEQYYQMTLLLQLFNLDTATGEDLDERAKEIQPAVLVRGAAVAASGNLVFSRARPVGTVSIPVGTKAKTSDGKIFVTTVAGQITPTSPEQIPGNGIGRDSGLIAAVAEEPGEDGNVATNTIIKFVSKLAGVDEVTNLAAFQFGSDEESDDSFRARIKAYVASLARSTITALESAVLGEQDPTTGATVLFVKAIEDMVNRGIVTVYIDDGSGSAESTTTVTGEIVTAGLAPGDTAVGGETQLNLDEKPIKESLGITVTSDVRGVLIGGFSYAVANDYWVNSASGQINFKAPGLTAGEQLTADYSPYTGLIAYAQKIIDGDPNDRTNFPGVRAGGVLVYVRTPAVQTITPINVTLTVNDSYDQVTVQNEVKEAIKNYVNTLGISGDVLVSALYQTIMDVTGVNNVIITSPATDVIILDDQIARTSDGDININ